MPRPLLSPDVKVPRRRTRRACGVLLLLLPVAPLGAARAEEAPWPQPLQRVLDSTEPLAAARGSRLPLYLWPARNPGRLGASQTEALLRELDGRGIGLVSSWSPGDRERSLTEALAVARAQKKLGLRVNVDATGCLYAFFNGDERTAHRDAAGRPFFDATFGKKDMGCPFAIDFRRADIRSRIEHFAAAYHEEGLAVDFVFADWEVDGPLEWNNAWEASHRCVRCRDAIPHIDDFLSYQHALRELRSALQRDVYATPLLERFPRALVGNYAVYPHNGFRYWYDYFERYVPGQPALADQRARYRHWSNDFEGTGYTFAMPVVYTWSWTFRWYDFDVPDYRWFYNMLLVASNAGRHTPQDVPIIAFVHWHTTVPPEPADPEILQMSPWAYQELLWHMLLRGTDTFFLWCMAQEETKEIELLHPVWADAQRYGEFLDAGVPITFDVPTRPGPVVSGLRLGSRLLVRRTDFTAASDAVTVRLGDATVEIPRLKNESAEDHRQAGACQVIEIPGIIRAE